MRILLALLLCLPGWVNAEIYQWQDAQGSKHFSDRPVADAKIVDIKPGYGFNAVKTVYDGDTVVLVDGRKIRLLGINTPEVQHLDKLADAGGDEAKEWLTDKLKNTKVRLEVGVEKTDKYGRTLAHLFTEKKEHINLQLVAAGLAVVNIYPPNLHYVDELVKAQNQAEQAKLGIWQRPEYAAMSDASLTEAGHPGWTRLVGKVAGVRKTRKSTYLEFTDMFEARIENKWLDLFPDVDSYVGKTIEVRGWLSKSKGHFFMLIRHPSSIKEDPVF
jgi:micrococcal nuclease